MCGIVYSQSFVGKPVNKTVIKRYLAQRNRGTDGFGFYVPDTNRLTHNVREGRILSLLRREKGSEILFHHRFPTSTMNVRNACHPFSTKDFFDHNYVVVHNGVLWNEDALKKEHEKLGIKYVSEQEDGSFNDSEALAYDIALYLEGKQKSLKASGSIAFIAIQRDAEGNKTGLFFGRNEGNPLRMKATKKSITLSSEGEGELIETDKLYQYDYLNSVFTMRDLTIPYPYTSSRKTYGNYQGYGYGYNWDDDGLEDYTYRGGREWQGNTDTSSYFLNDETDYRNAEKSYVQHEKLRLMHDAYEDEWFAIELGEYELNQMKERESELYELVEVKETATDAQVDEYCSIGDQIWYLREALSELRRGVLGQSQMGFQYNPRTV